MRPMTFALSFLAVLPAGGAGAGDGSLPEPAAVISFDTSADAMLASGQRVGPLEARNVGFTSGIRGRALLAEKGIVLRYPRSILPIDEGSVALWVRLTTPLREGGWRFFFSDGTAWGRTGMPRLWFYTPGMLRLDVDVGMRFHVHPVPPWPHGQWAQLAFTWNAGEGRTVLYFGGEVIGRLDEPIPWQAEDCESFRIGSGLNLPGENTNLPAFAAIDEVAIYDQVLSPHEVARVRQSTGVPEIRAQVAEESLEHGVTAAPIVLTNVGHGEADSVKRNGVTRVSEPLHSGRDYLRHFGYATRHLDPVMITVGGYVLGTQGAEPELREFATAFRALPAVRFRTFRQTDDLIVRHAEAEGKRWIYALNLSAMSLPVTIDADPSAFRDAVTGKAVPGSRGKIELPLKPYGLVALCGR